MKLFVILSRVPYPLEKGDKLRAFHQIRELSKSHEIILCCLSDQAVHPQAREILQQYCTQLHIFQLTKWRIILNLFFGLFSRKPFQVIYFYQRPIHRQIQHLIRQVNPDHIFCQLIRTAEYAKNEHNFRKTIDYQDALSKGMERRSEKARFPLRQLLEAERFRLVAYENVIFEYFDVKTIISGQDRRFIYHPEQRKIRIIPNGIDTEFFKPRPESEKKYDLLFCGNMSYPPNVDSALFIARQILPLARAKGVNLQVLIAGSSPLKIVRELDKTEGITVSGWMDDIRDAYAASRIFIAPMQIGTGLQNKLLEAMAMELPCISSELANNALGAEPESQILIGNSAEEYVELILKLLNDYPLQKSLAANGRRYVMGNFSWSASTSQLATCMEAAQSGAENKIEI